MAAKKTTKKAPAKSKAKPKAKASATPKKTAEKKAKSAAKATTPEKKQAKNTKKTDKKPLKVRMHAEKQYDSVPYESYVYAQTHPDSLYTIATLFGLKPTKPNKARVLEIGSASGGNLIPFAIANPKSKCLGLDISGAQIEMANDHVKALKLKNTEFRREDISAIDYDLGEFDYIICHGVYSWVPEKVRNAIMETCRRNLAEGGLAVISYNTLPGWNAVKSLRDMMLYHTQNFKEPEQKVRESRNLLNFLSENAPQSNQGYRQIIDAERKILEGTNDTYLYHDHLEQENNQFYLHEFIDHAHKHDLAYVGDTSITTMYIGNFNQKVQQTLQQIPQIERQEQYIDFLINRRFRHSILAKASGRANINRNIQPEAIFNYHIRATFQQVKTPAGQPMKFQRPGTEETLQVKDPAGALLFSTMARIATKPVAAEEIIKAAAKAGKLKDDTPLRKVMSEFGVKLALQGFLVLHAAGFDCAEEISKKPRAYSLARYQATLPNVSKVTTITHQSVGVDIFSKTLLPHLDGKNDMKALITKMKDHVEKGEINVKKDGKPVTDQKVLGEILDSYIRKALDKMVKASLLEA